VLVCAFLLSRKTGVVLGTVSSDRLWDFRVFFDMLVLILVYVITFYRYELYRPRRLCPRLAVISDVFIASLLAALIYLSISFLTGLSQPPRDQALLFLGFSTMSLMGYRLVLCAAGRVRRKKQEDRYNILVVGSRVRAREVIKSIEEKGEDIHVIGCLDTDVTLVGKTVCRDVKVIGTMEDYHGYLLGNVVDEVIFAMPLSLLDNALDYLAFADELGVNVRVLPNWQLYEMSYFPRNAIMMFDMSSGFPSLTLSSMPRKAGQLMLKEITDLCGAMILSIIFSPLMLVIAAIVKFSSPGPVLFKQTRLGLNGRKFTIYKSYYYTYKPLVNEYIFKVTNKFTL